MRTLRPLLWLSPAALALLLAGCGSAEGSGCDLREDDDLEPRCQERTGLQGLPVFGATCDAIGGVSLEGGCPREGIVLGCVIGSEAGGEVIDWYYEPMTREAVEAECEREDAPSREP